MNTYIYIHTLSFSLSPTHSVFLPFYTLLHITTRCYTLQHTATQCNTLQLTATHSVFFPFYTLQHTPTHSNTLQQLHVHVRIFKRANTLQHIATHCNTLQHTATPVCPRTHLQRCGDADEMCDGTGWKMSVVIHPFTCVTWLIHMWVWHMTHSHLCDMTHPHLCPSLSRMNKSCHTFEWVISHIRSDVWQGYAIWPIRTYVPPSLSPYFLSSLVYIRPDFLAYGTTHVYWDMTHSYVWHNSFMWETSHSCETWLIDMRHLSCISRGLCVCVCVCVRVYVCVCVRAWWQRTHESCRTWMSPSTCEWIVSHMNT